MPRAQAVQGYVEGGLKSQIKNLIPLELRFDLLIAYYTRERWAYLVILCFIL